MITTCTRKWTFCTNFLLCFFFLQDHRQQLDPSNYNIYVEMDFYNFLIGRFVEWMYGAIKESNQASIWKILVAYQKIVTGMEHVGELLLR